MKATRKLSAEIQLFSQMKDFKIKNLFKDPSDKTFLTKVGFFTLFLISFFMLTGADNHEKIVLNPSESLEKFADLTDSDIQARLNEIKEIKVKTNSHHES